MGELRKHVWNERLLLEINSRYYGCLAARYYSWDKWTKIFLAVCSSSGAIGGWTIWNSEAHPNFALAWKIVSSAAALFAVALPFLNFGKKLEYASRLKAEYSDLHHDYMLLWMRIDASEKKDIEKEVDKLWNKEKKLTPLEKNFPKPSMRLFNKCQDEVVKCLGLEKGKNHE